MKKVKYLMVLFLFFHAMVSLRAQKQNLISCYTPFDVPDPLGGYNFSQNSVQNPVKVIRVYAHIVRTTQGTRGISISQLNTVLNLLANDFNGHSICFSLLGTDYIDNSTYIDVNLFTRGLFNPLINTNAHSNAIDMYFLPLDNSFLFASADAIPGRAFVLAGSHNNPNTGVVTYYPISREASHEMGHCLGLFHTFHGTWPGEQVAGVTCQELVNGSNSSTCGDYVYDSPADPVPLGINYTNAFCQLTNMTLSDSNGDIYVPDTRNIMSYTPGDCKEYFTDGQGQRMWNTINISPILQTRVVPPTVFVQNINFTAGSNLYASSERVISGYNVTTTIPNGYVISSGSSRLEYRASNSIELQPGFLADPTSDGVFKANLSLVCNILSENNNAQKGGSSEGNYSFLNYNTINPKREVEVNPNSSILNERSFVTPNPFVTTINLVIYSKQKEILSINIVDVHGRIIQNGGKNYYINAGHNNISLDGCHLNQGIYFIVITSKYKTSAIKILKQ